jgi:linoleoyl-CoA desaturase
MQMEGFFQKDIRFQFSREEGLLYKTIRDRGRNYFKENGIAKTANRWFVIKVYILFILAAAGFTAVLHTQGIISMFVGYCLLGFSLMLLGINVGHDAAHHALTGNRKIDDNLFRIVFGLQGMSGYVWQLRHNYSHHILPNVEQEDTDLEMGKIIVLEHGGETSWYHKYQHIYAPFLYGLAGMVMLLFKDLEMLLRKKHGNLTLDKIPTIEYFKFALAKLSHLSIFIILPLLYHPDAWQEVLLAYAMMQILVSIFMVFTFVISHHVMEVARAEVHFGTEVENSWVKHQITTTIDFDGESKIANFLFGGFNLHVAHHLFPEVCHIHYPQLTAIIKDTLQEFGHGDWYQSYSFWEGCRSHLRYLKEVGTGSDTSFAFEKD